ncbi:MAG: DUF255 domain-containing protein, partial [Gammaproteobacteria bacterium]|nr:DUF255 domain-containing protein [Gammaproteobacteria bacterium]
MEISMPNVLDQETSPYLLQHKDNPVHWQPWGQEALDQAKREGKPILLSVGYAACHWCHVMAHESFEDEGVAAVMNDLYINIKVDREERPDIDNIYQTALALLGEQGGWPLTMFLNSKGEPFWGGTYFPKETAYGRPGFTHVLESVHGIFQNEPEKVTKNRDILRSALKKHNELPEGDRPKLTLCTGRPIAFVEALCRVLQNRDIPCVAENGVWLFDPRDNQYSMDPS